jgi:hypothetical protein
MERPIGIYASSASRRDLARRRARLRRPALVSRPSQWLIVFLAGGLAAMLAERLLG